MLDLYGAAPASPIPVGLEAKALGQTAGGTSNLCDFVCLMAGIARGKHSEKPLMGQKGTLYLLMAIPPAGGLWPVMGMCPQCAWWLPGSRRRACGLALDLLCQLRPLELRRGQNMFQVGLLHLQARWICSAIGLIQFVCVVDPRRFTKRHLFNPKMPAKSQSWLAHVGDGGEQKRPVIAVHSIFHELCPQRDDAKLRGKPFVLAVMFLQVAILLNSIAGLIKAKKVWWASGPVAIAGLVFFADGFQSFF